MSKTGRNLQSALESATDHLASQGISNPQFNAEIILCHVLGCKRLDLRLNLDQKLTEEQEHRIDKLVVDRSTFRPLPYVLGETEFMGLLYKVDERALVPRQETELLVEAVLERLRDVQTPLVGDVGTGCGVVGLSIAHFRRDARVHAIDLSKDALKLATENAASLDLTNVTFHLGNIVEPLVDAGICDLDALCCNLPYVPQDVIETLQAEVRYHEPRIALDGGVDGLDVYRQAARLATNVLRSEGFIACEMGAGQSEEMQSIFAPPSWQDAQILKDYSGIDRTLIAKRR